jgi:penicillin-binding protein 2
MLEFHSQKKFRTIKRKKQDIEPQEVFLDGLAQKKEKELGAQDRKFETPVSEKTLKGILFFIILILFCFFLKTFQLQILNYDKYSKLSYNNEFIIGSINSARGVIYDSDGKQLVFNKLSFDLILDKDKLPKEESEKLRILKEMGELINKDYEEFEELILENIDHQTLVLLETKINDLPGFEIKHNYIRYYDQGPAFSHILGYVGKITKEEIEKESDFYTVSDYIGREGLESFYENILRKNPGTVRIERDVYGNLLSKEIISLPESGDSLVLWLDSDLQNKTEQVLEEAVNRIGSKNAVAIAMNPKTGGILSLVNIPFYDNNLFSKGADKEELKKLLIDPNGSLFNRAIAGLYVTGSTIKPLIASAALEENIIDYKTDIICQGEITIPNKYDPSIIYKHTDLHIHGATDMRKAIAESCNVYFYTIGGGYKKQEGLGPTRIKKYLELFGWGNKTGIDLPAEEKGLVPSPEWKQENKGEGWWDGDTYNLSIGQGDIMVTPIQVVTAFSAIANGGILLEPKLVKEIVDNDKKLIEELKPKIIRDNFIDPDNLEIIRQGMRWAVTGQNSPNASSVTLNSLPVEVAAKTGTAQTPYDNHFHNWITVFAPYDDPEIVLTLMFENVEDIRTVALPAAKEILEWYFTQ